MRNNIHISDNRNGVANLLGYLLSFCVASMMLVSAVFITTQILNDRTAAVADLQAQSIANKVADAVVEAVTVWQSMPNADYTKTLDLPSSIGGRSYYVDVTDTTVYLNTTDGLVKKICSTYNVENLNIGVSSLNRIYGGKVNISIKRADVVSRFDFGTGNITSHSPVESGYLFVSNRSQLCSSNPQVSLRDPMWWDSNYTYRVPILIKNDSPEDLVDTPVKVVLNTSNFDYSHANVTVTPSYNVSTSDLVFYESSNVVIADVQLSTAEWDPKWFYTYNGTPVTETLNATIKELEGGYNLSDIDGTTIKLNGSASCTNWNQNTGVAKFNYKDALESLENGKHFLDKRYTVTVSGLLKNGMQFLGSCPISIKNAIYVGPNDQFSTIENAVSNAPQGSTIFVKKGTYCETGGVTISTSLNIIGEDEANTVIYSNRVPVKPPLIEVLNTDHVNVDSFTVENNGDTNYGIYIVYSSYINITNCESYNCAVGIFVDGTYGDCSDIDISGCKAHGNHGDGISITSAELGYPYYTTIHYIYITNCESYENNNSPDGNSNGLGIYNCGNYAPYRASYITAVNCKFYNNVGSDCNGVYIENGHGVTIKGCQIYGHSGTSGDGVDINSGSNQNIIKDCNIYSNTGRSGVLIAQWDSDYNYVIGCNISFNTWGVYVYALPWNNEINYCNIYNNTAEGVFFSANLFDGNNVRYCNIYNNGYSGTGLAGIFLGCSNWSIIEHCNIFDNGCDGICLGRPNQPLTFSSNNTIQWNNIYCNGKFDPTGVGVYCASSLDPYCSSVSLLLASIDNRINYNNFGNDSNPSDSTPLAVDLWDPWLRGHANNWDYNFWRNYDGCYEWVNGYGNCYPVGLAGCEYDHHPIQYSSWDKAYQNITPVILVGFTCGAVVSNPWAHYHVVAINTSVDNLPSGGGSIWVYRPVDLYGSGCDSYTITTQIYISKPMSIIAQSNDFYIDGNNQGYPLFLINAPNVNITGFDIRNSGSNGGGILVTSSTGYANITNCKIDFNKGYGINISTNYSNIENCSISSNGQNGIGNGINIFGNSRNNNIANCDISLNSQNGISIIGTTPQNCPSNNSVKYCNINNNSNCGVYIKNTKPAQSPAPNNIFNSDITLNNYGIYIESSGQVIVNLSDITLNYDGVRIIGSSNNAFVEKCNIKNNAEGVYMGDSSGSNKILSCDIASNTQIGINITGSATSNIIFNNTIQNNGIAYDGNAKDNSSGGNTWDNGYIDSPTFPNFLPYRSETYNGGGNLWSNYDEESEGARDYKKGPNQDKTGSDGIADNNYTIPGGAGSKDNYSLCRKPCVRPYYIDFWNPRGESTILVNVSLMNYTSEYIYLYYGYNKPLDDSFTHNMSGVSVFFDDFNDTILFNSQWDLSGAPGLILENGCVNLSNKKNITTKNYSIPTVGDPPRTPLSYAVNESMYIVEARMKINSGQGNMILLNKTISGNKCRYLVSANLTSPYNLSLDKIAPVSYQLDNVSTSNLSNWIRMKSYVYLCKTYSSADQGSQYNTSNVTYINNYIYDFDTFANQGNVSMLDTYWCIDGTTYGEPAQEKARNDPYMYGSIGLGSGMLSTQTSDILVDWIRVMKTPVVPPTVIVGSTEAINYGWADTTYINSSNIMGDNPFTPGPVLSDFNYGNETGTFVIKNLPTDEYTITVTMGNYTGVCNITRVAVKVGGETLGTLTLTETKKGEFETGWVTVDKQSGDLNIEFSTDAGKNWAVNSMIIERGEKGLKIEQG